MKYHRLFIPLLLLFPLFANAELLIRNTDGTFLPQQEKADVVLFLSELNDKAGISIRCDDTMNAIIELPRIELGLSQLIRVVEGQFSTIQGFDDKGQLTSIDVLPLGEYGGKRNLVPVAQLAEAKVAQNPATAAQGRSNSIPAHIDISNVTEADWKTLTKEEAQAVRREINRKRKEESRKYSQEQRLQRDREFADSIEQLKTENPDLHAIMVERYAKRLERANPTEKSDD
ncbi:hypothetical protein [uncultured Thalassolituus sp.]|uniref:hypothetical protein n=1 Tax=uncultured Thalassolituus sp. TaxID=285273 RepID=UPI00261250CE|nr:hypothetical protein [uncultured Thalassolituus sp.]